jgi:hypothetical protein
VSDTPNRRVLAARIRQVARALGPWADEVALFGAGAPACYDLGTVDVRPTEDVDLLVPGGYSRWQTICEQLRSDGFREMPDVNVHRMAKGELQVDVVRVEQPLDEEALETRIAADGTNLRVIRPIYFLALKFDAYRDPRREDSRDAIASKDLDDIITVIRGLPGLIDEVAQSGEAVHRSVRRDLIQLAERPDALDVLRAHIEPDEASQRQAEPLLQRLLALRAP